MGFVVARAVLAQCERHGSYNKMAWEEREWDVPLWFWSNFTGGKSTFEDWAVGQFSGAGATGGTDCSITMSGVHFHRPSLEAFLGLSNAQAGKIATEVPRGRRPSYDWPWAVSTIWGRLSRGELIPATQSDIEMAMIDVLKVGNVEPGESTVRPYAKMIFEDYMRT